MTSLRIEVLDIVQHTRGHISNPDPMKTATELNRRDGGFMSYGPAFSHSKEMVAGLVKDQWLRSHTFDRRTDVNRYILEVALGWNNFLSSNASRWHPTGSRIIKASNGIWIKPSIKGIALVNGKPIPVMAVCRRSIDLADRIHKGFLMRAGFELHLRDEPSFEDLAIVDLTTGAAGQARDAKIYRLTEHEMMPIDEFEHIVSKYLEAVELSKYVYKNADFEQPSDIFRGR